jgi:hypothetical protein
VEVKAVLWIAYINQKMENMCHCSNQIIRITKEHSMLSRYTISIEELDF